MSRPSLTEACTKIVATVGPACATPQKLSDLIEAGVDIFRINTAHGDRAQHEQALARYSRGIRYVRVSGWQCCWIWRDQKSAWASWLPIRSSVKSGCELSFVRGDDPARQRIDAFGQRVDEFLREIDRRTGGR